MNKRNLRARLEKIEAAFAQRGLTDETPVDISETLAIIDSVRPDMIRLSEIDRKRWYCPDDPRRILSDEESEEEARLKLRTLEKCARLGFPDGYGQREYRKDRHELHLLSEKEAATDFIKLGIREQAEKTLILARRRCLYEPGPKNSADERIKELDRHEPDGFFRRTLFEWHEVYHLEVLHPEEPYDDEEISWMMFPEHYRRELAGKRPDTTQEALDEWHSRKGEDPRLFKHYASWMQYPMSANALRRQNEQLAELGFEPDTNTLQARKILAGKCAYDLQSSDERNWKTTSE